MTPDDVFPAIHSVLFSGPFWFYDDPMWPSSGVVMYGERAWPSFALLMIC